MSFKEKLPDWYAEGLEPTETQKKTGYTPGIKPPAQWFNWHLNRSYEVMKELQEKAVHIDKYTQDVTDTLLPDVADLGDRLNTTKTSDITLQPGVQVIQAAKDTRFRLGEIRGKTLVSPSPDLLGGKGNFESSAPITPFFNDPLVRRLDSGGIDNSKCLEIELTKTSGTGGIDELIQLAKGKYYVAVAMVKNITTDQCAIGINGIQGAFVASKEYAPAFLRFTEAQVTTGSSTRVGLMAQGSPGNTARMDNLRVYEISKADYDSLATMTAEQVAEKYPFGLIGIRGVDGPYAVATSDNLLPPFYEWTVTPGATSDDSVIEPYSLRKTVSDAAQPTEFVVSVVGGQVLTLSYKSSHPATAYINIQWLTGEREPISWTDQNAGEQTVTAPDNAKYARVTATTLAAGTFTFENPTLIVGSEPKPFKPQRKSMLAFQTELHADPNDGSDPDELYEQNGQYFKLAKWRKLLLDGSLQFNLHIPTTSDANGYKVVYANIGTIPSESFLSKFNGLLLSRFDQSGAINEADQFAYDAPGYLFISISNVDSGWGPDYSPTQDEIKAYFMGWTMYDGSAAQTGEVNPDNPSNNIYNGIGTKAWARRVDGISRKWIDGTFTLPTTQAPNWTPYQLLYRLAKAIVEPVVSEGCLTLAEGDNMIEVGTGIVLRESAKPTHYSNNGNYYINNTAVSGSLLKNRVSRILRVYRNDRVDNSAKIENDVNAYGKQHVRFLPSDFDPTATYSVTYLKLEKSLVAPITGTLASNEKAQISDLTAGVAEALQRVSVVEQKKAEKDAPGWITPTLLNGWTGSVMYKKMSNGLVKLEGQAVPGAVGTMFRLPLEYRPSRALHFGVMSKGDNVTKMAWLAVDVNGDVNISEFASTWVGLDEVTYLAGQ